MGKSRCLTQWLRVFLEALCRQHLFRACIDMHKLERITKLRKYGVMIMKWKFTQRLFGLIKGFAEPIKCKRGEQEVHVSAYCERKAGITQADKEKDTNCYN